LFRKSDQSWSARKNYSLISTRIESTPMRKHRGAGGPRLRQPDPSMRKTKVGIKRNETAPAKYQIRNGPCIHSVCRFLPAWLFSDFRSRDWSDCASTERESRAATG